MCPRPLLSWSDRRTRAIVWQVVAVAAVCGILSLIAIETATNLRLRGIASGFDYLGRAAGFEIARGPLSYSSQDTYLRALEVGLVNTLRITVLGSVIATSLGLLVGIARLSTIWVVSGLSTAYVEVLRNTPLLLQLLFWCSVSRCTCSLLSCTSCSATRCPDIADTWKGSGSPLVCENRAFGSWLLWALGFGQKRIMFQIEMRDVNKWFGAFQVLCDINMKVARGERIAICGPSGSGKSTLIRCINGLEKHQKGMVIVNGEELTSDVNGPRIGGACRRRGLKTPPHINTMNGFSSLAELPA